MENIEQVFQSISSQYVYEYHKHFNKFIFKNEKFKLHRHLVLNHSSFWDITFSQFQGENIRLISHHAFGKAVNTIEKLEIWKSYINHLPPTYHIWKALSGLVNAKEISIYLNVSEIPSQAFNGKQVKLNVLRLKIKKQLTINKKAFYQLENLQEISFYGQIHQIQSQAFEFAKRQNQTLHIVFNGSIFVNNINGDVFQPESFQGIQIQIPIQIVFGVRINYIPQSSFKTILSNQNNTIQFANQNNINQSANRIGHHIYINCSDCRNFWMIIDNKDKQVIGAKCKHNYDLTIFANSSKCHLLRKCKNNHQLTSSKSQIQSLFKSYCNQTHSTTSSKYFIIILILFLSIFK